VFANRFGARTSPGRIARLVDSTIGGPPLVAAAGFDAKRLERVREVAAAAARASSEWREDWFDADFWRDSKPYLLDVEENYRRRGQLRSVTAIGQNGVQDTTKPSYRVVFEHMTGVMTFEFGENGEIKSFQAEDE
jgi:hypothetical protein